MRRVGTWALVCVGLLGSLACTGLLPLEQRLPSLCEAAVEGASVYETQARRASPELVEVCVDWYGTWAEEEDIATLECMAAAEDAAQWRACRPEYQAPGILEEAIVLQVAPLIELWRDSEGGRVREEPEEGLTGTVGEAPVILGALDRSLIDEVIRGQMNPIRTCYEKGLARNPSLGGEVVVRFVIIKDGTVYSAQIRSTTLHDEEVEACITGQIMRAQFPEPEGGDMVIVSYPFQFTPG